MDDILTDDQMVGGQPQSDDDVLTDDDMVGGVPLPSSSRSGAFARGAAEGAIPAVGGLGVGLGTGALATAATGNPLIGLGAGLAAGFGAGEVISRGQDWAMEKLGLREEGNFSHEQQLADEIEHPYLKAAGAAAPSALLLKPTGALAQRAVGAAIGGGVTAADELIREGEIDPGKVAIGAGTGALLPSANRAGRAVESVGARAGSALSPYVPSSLKPTPEAYGPPKPDPFADDITVGHGDTRGAEEEIARNMFGERPKLSGPSENNRPPLDGDVLPPDLPQGPDRGGPSFDLDPSQYADTTGQRALSSPPREGDVLPPDTSGLGAGAWIKELQGRVTAAEIQLQEAPPEAKPFWEKALIFAEDNLAKMQRYGQGKGDPTHFVDASLGPAGDEHPFTYADSDRANYQPSVARGTATEQTRVSENPNTGNPVGSAGANRIAARPNSPLRDYAKDRPLLESQYRIDIDRPGSPIAEDIQAALKALEPPKPTEAPAPKPTEAPQPAPAPAEQPSTGRFDGIDMGTERTKNVQLQAGRRGMPPERVRELEEIDRIDRKIIDKTATPEEEAKYDAFYQEAADHERNITNPSRQDVTAAVTPRPTLSLKGRPNGAPRDIKLNRGERVVRPEQADLPVTPIDRYAPVTREEPSAPKTLPDVAGARKYLETRGHKSILQAFDALPPAEQQRTAERIMAGEPAKVEENQRRNTPEHRQATKVGDKVVQLGSGEVGKRRAASLAAFTDAAREMPDASFKLDLTKDTASAALDHASKLFANAKSKYNGEDPTERGVGYTPNEKPPEFNLVAAARKFVNNPTPKNMKGYIEALALKGKTGPKVDEGLGLNQKAAVYDEATVAAKTVEGLPDIEPYVSKGDMGVNFDRAQVALREWVKDLTPHEWDALNDRHEGTLELTIKANRNPEDVLAQLKQERETIPKERPSAEPVEEPVEEAAPAPKSAEDELATLIGEQAKDAKSQQEAEDAYTRPIDKGLKSAMHDFLYKDVGEEGFLDFGAIGNDLAALAKRLRSSVASFASTPAQGRPTTAPQSPRSTAQPLTPANLTWVASAAKDYLDWGHRFIKTGFTSLNNKASQFKFTIKAEIDAATADKAKLLTKDEGVSVFRAREDKNMAAASPKEKAYNDQWIQPRADLQRAAAVAYVDLARKMQVPHADELKYPKDNGPGYAEWMPHVLDKEMRPVAEQDPASNTLSSFASHAETRSHFTLQNVATGERILYNIDPNKPGEITLLRNGAPRRVATGQLDMAEIGTDIPMTVKGKKGIWKVDNAKVREVRDNAGRNPDGTPKVDFIENPHFALLAAHTNVELATNRLKTLQGIIDSPIFQANTARTKAEVEKNGWPTTGQDAWVEHTALPQLKGHWMPPAFDWHFQDFVKQGIQVPDSVAHAKAMTDKFSQSSAKLLFAFGGPVHGFNVLEKAIVGRGKDWFTPQGWKGLGKLPQAFKSVLSQDAVQREMTIAPNPGDPVMNMMYVHTVTRDVLPEAARKLGEDMTKNASKWDPFAKQFGITTPQLLRNFYRSVSSAPLWLFTDTLGTHRYLELRGQGLSRNDAINKANKSIDDYVAAATYVGTGQKGRLFQQFLTDPTVSWFTAFHQHNFHMLANMVAPFMRKATTAERVDAAAQMALLGGMLSIAFPALSAGYAALTGNKHSEFERRGVSRVAGLGLDLATGKKGYEDIARNVWTPSSLADTAIRIPQNRTFSGKKIVNPADMRDWRNIPRAAGQAGEFALQQYASPYKVISTAAERPGATPGTVAGRFAESMFNLKTPTPQSVMQENKRPITQMRDARQRQNHPTGLLESVMNKIAKKNSGG